MTTRDQVRRAIGSDRADAHRAGLAGDPGPNLPERLFTARERKGVDLYRAERDTKIRARYLAALERGDYKELPGPVYTKGFLRNYALYLGLDPDEVLLQWRRERGDPREGEKPVIVVPRPIATPRKGLAFSPAIVVAALMTLAIIAFGAYLGVQLLRFAKPPTIAVTEPRTAVLEVDESVSSYVLRGTSIAGATISIVVPGLEQPYRVSADADGTWRAEVDLRRGRNQFEITATDPETGKQSDGSARVFITVPFLAVEAPTLIVDQPAEGATFENGAIPIHGTTTNARRVVVSATYLGPPGSVPSPGTPSDPSAPAASAKPAKPVTPAPTPVPPGIPAPVTVEVGEDGAFTTPYELTAGTWAITVTASSAEGKTAALTRNVTVVFEGVNLAVTIKGGRAWIKVWVDGAIDPRIGAAGSIVSTGKTLMFSGRESVEVRTGSSGVTHFTLNGTSLGALGRSGVPETWLFAPPAEPVRTQRR
jgi:cytoskeletal protein RodZ